MYPVSCYQEENYMNYILKLKNKPLLTFGVVYPKSQSSKPVLNHIQVCEENRSLLPVSLEPAPGSLKNWLSNRAIPPNRAYADKILSLIGQSLDDPVGMILASKGLSLNDSYWIVEDDFSGTFEEWNLYENSFDPNISCTALTGNRSEEITHSSLNGIIHSPEFTTNGQLPKAWVRSGEKIVLYKAGSGDRLFRASNEGFEPYSEYYASQLAEYMGIRHVSYTLEEYEDHQDILCSVCELFTDINTSYVPVWNFIQNPNLKSVYDYYRMLGTDFSNDFEDMILFDWLILNTDRHYGNFGLLLKSDTNEILKTAPLFDHGLSLLNFLAPEYWKDFDKVLSYASRQMPKCFNSTFDQEYLEFMLKILKPRHKTMLEKLLKYEFIPDPFCLRSALPENRLRNLTLLIRQRAGNLLDRIG